MKLEQPSNENYAALVVTLKNFEDLDNCDNLKHAIVFGNRVIVSKDTEEGTRGIYFPVECQISEEFLSQNNLFRDKEKNSDQTKAGFFEDNRRVKCLKLRGNASEGFFIPLYSLNYLLSDPYNKLNDGDVFDTIRDAEICRKHVVKRKVSQQGQGKKAENKKKKDKLVEGQFRFHKDTAQIQRNLHHIHPTTQVHISSKIHGSSFIVSNILCKKPLNTFLRFMNFCGVPIVDKEYNVLHASRKVIKNRFFENFRNSRNHFYSMNIWKEAGKILQPFLKQGMTVYGEIAGYTPDGGHIQKGYDYGCSPTDSGPNFRLFIYRITVTTPDGTVHEYSPRMIHNWRNMITDTLTDLAWQLQVVPELFEGSANDILDIAKWLGMVDDDNNYEEDWRLDLLEEIRNRFKMEEDCTICSNKVPMEGVVVRLLETNNFDAYKFKSFRFQERESKEKDKGTFDMEEEQIEEESSEIT